jgi:subtilase family serine protease
VDRVSWPALAAIGIAWAGAAMASPEPVERSGGAYHVAICGRSIAPGMARCHAHLVTDRTGAPLAHTVAPNQAPFGYGPADLQSAYNVASPGSSKITVAVVDAYGYANAEADLAVYRAQYGLPACTTANGCFQKLNESGVAGADPAWSLPWAEETALDLDMISAMCPNCKIMLVEANSAELADLGASVNMAVAKGARVVNNSYGGVETGSVSYEADYNHDGVAITASAGDNGYGAAFPATSPHVIAVGGTTLIQDPTTTRGWSETTWAGGGSGCSVFYAKPRWQKDRGCAMRMVADVAAVADPEYPVAVYGPLSSTSSTWLVFGGTSVSAPVVAGIYGVRGRKARYGANAYAAPKGSLNDVTTGANGTCPVAYYCHAEVGYDGPTGLGTPNGVTAF